MKFRLESTSFFAHFYTVPWSFENLYLSMLSSDDQHITHENIRSLIIDNSLRFCSSRFPNVHTLYINNFSHLFPENFQGFTRLRTLTVNQLNLVPTCVIQRLHTLTLFQIEELLNDETIYPNLEHLYIKQVNDCSLASVISIEQHFPRLQSLEFSLQPDETYFHSLDYLINGKSFSNLLFLRTNWKSDEGYCSNINQWLISKTLLKLRSTTFSAYQQKDDLIICF